MEHLEQYKKAMKSERINAINIMMKEFGLEEITTLLELGIKTPNSFALLCIQNVMHCKNVDRYHAFTKGTYVSPFEEGKIREELKKIYNNVVTSEIAKAKTGGLEYFATKKLCKDFINAETLAKAAVVVYNEDVKFLGKTLAKLFGKGVPCPNLMDKLKLILTGKLNGYPIFKDGCCYEINKTKHVYNIVRCNKHLGYDWSSVFPSCNKIAENSYKSKRNEAQATSAI